jgi:hypothetical protein
MSGDLGQRQMLIFGARSGQATLIEVAHASTTMWSEGCCAATNVWRHIHWGNELLI